MIELLQFSKALFFMHKSKRGGVVNNELKTYEQAETDYMNGFKYKEIAEKYNVLISTVKSWKTRYNWNRCAVEKACVQKWKKYAYKILLLLMKLSR